MSEKFKSELYERFYLVKEREHKIITKAIRTRKAVKKKKKS